MSTEHDGDFIVTIGGEEYCVDWGPSGDECPGTLMAAVYKRGEHWCGPHIYVHADDQETLFSRALEAARTLRSEVDWFKEWDHLSRAILDEADYCAGAAWSAERRGQSMMVARAYREFARRLRRIHAGHEAVELQEALQESLVLGAPRGEA